MAKKSKLENKAKKAIGRAEHAIEVAQEAAKKLDRKTRSEAEKLTQKLEKAITPKAVKQPKAPKAAKPPKAPKQAKTAKQASKQPKAAKQAKSAKTSKQPKAAQATAALGSAPPVRPDYRTVAMLRGQAKAAGVRGFSSMTRAQLIDALAGA